MARSQAASESLLTREPIVLIIDRRGTTHHDDGRDGEGAKGNRELAEPVHVRDTDQPGTVMSFRHAGSTDVDQANAV